MKRLLIGLVTLLLAVPQAYADLIPTQGPERQRVMSLVERPEVAQQLERMGISPQEGKARVAAMSEEEIASLAGKLDSLPAGGALSNQDFLFIIIVVLIVLLLVAL
jgi:hypothetical protein